MHQLESFSDQNEQINIAPRRVMHGLFIDCLKNQCSLIAHHVGPDFLLAFLYIS